MSRDLTTDTENALAAGHVRFLVFVEMDFSSGMLRVNNSAINLDWNGYPWQHRGGSSRPCDWV